MSGHYEISAQHWAMIKAIVIPLSAWAVPSEMAAR